MLRARWWWWWWWPISWKNFIGYTCSSNFNPFCPETSFSSSYFHFCTEPTSHGEFHHFYSRYSKKSYNGALFSSGGILQRSVFVYFVLASTRLRGERCLVRVRITHSHWERFILRHFCPVWFSCTFQTAFTPFIVPRICRHETWHFRFLLRLWS